MKYCSNKECGAELTEDSRFCFVCGSQYKEAEKKRFNFMKKKEVERSRGEVVQPSELEDFRLVRPQIMQQSMKKTDELVIVEMIQRVEQKIDIVLGNHSWMLSNLDNYLQAFKKKQEDDDESKTTKNI